MGKNLVYALVISLSFAMTAQAEPQPKQEEQDVLTLYQVGKAGSYCVSLSPSEKGCISGLDGSGLPVNVMNLMKDKTVVFKNVSDAVHDMQFTGANAQDLPAQQPGAGDAVKKLGAEDPSKQKITCSYHGAQLQVGYSVTPRINQAVMGGGHKDPVSGEGGPDAAKQGPGGGGGGGGGAGGGSSGIGKIQNTKLADVSREVLSKAPASEVSKLVAQRPDLLPKLQEVRPLLAQEIAGGGSAKNGFPTNLAKGLGNLQQTGLNFNGLDGGAAGPGKAGGVGGAGGGAAGLVGGGAGKKVASATGTIADGLGALAVDLDNSPGSNKKRRLSNFDQPFGENGERGDVQTGAPGTKTAQQRLAQNGGKGATSQTSADGVDRVKLKTVKTTRSLASLEEGVDWNKWLILLLLIAAAFIARTVIKGTRAKR